MNSSMVDVVSQPRRLAKNRRRWMHDNNELHQAQVTIQELMDEKYRLESQLQAAGLKESTFVSEKNKPTPSCWSQGNRNWLITNGLVRAFEYLRQSESFVTLLDRLSTAAYQSGHHDGVYQGYFNCQQMGRITPAFQENRGKLQADMADALVPVCNDPLPAYAELVEKWPKMGWTPYARCWMRRRSLERNECFFSLLYTLFLRYFVKHCLGCV
ncbi:hypothetical protein Hdeb2414_s0019g00542621 [Helianthus debilis subsp. tardiflorus]